MELDVVSSSLPSDVSCFKLSGGVSVTCDWEHQKTQNASKKKK